MSRADPAPHSVQGRGEKASRSGGPFRTGFGPVGVLCRLVAMAGGLMLVAIAAMSVISIIGRWFAGTSIGGLEFGPVPGDFELVETGTAIAVFCFLPQAQLARAHVTVDLFTMRAGPGLRRALGVVADLLFAATTALLAWRLTIGLEERLTYGETTMILGLPQWWVYVPGVAFMALTALACLTTLAATLRGAVPPTEAEAAAAEAGTARGESRR
ncbi:TRAP transporter small permease [Tistrella mobilis]|uniref:TRAP transporter small permease n=1 Tax=Tistrella mobilis TaxID=171437 RepID=UPI003556B760